MAEISSITLPNGSTYSLKDTFTREACTELSSNLSAKSAVSVDNEHADANIVHISQEDYEQLVADGQTLSNAVYIVSADYVETYGQQIKNVADATDNDDAVNLGQALSAVNYAINNIADLSVSNSLTIGNVTITESDLSALKMLALQAPALLAAL